MICASEGVSGESSRITLMVYMRIVKTAEGSVQT